MTLQATLVEAKTLPSHSTFVAQIYLNSVYFTLPGDPNSAPFNNDC